MDLIIRKGTEKDFPGLLSLIHETGVLEGLPNSVKNSVELMQKEKDLFHFFVAEQDGELIGSAVCFFVWYTWVGKSLYLDDLYIKSEYRGKKIGTKLLQKIFEFAKENCKRLRFEVEEKNTKAQDFYRKLGAKMGDKWFNCDFDKEGIEAFIEMNKTKS